jgi:mannose-6-phosphate isomerase
MIAVTDCDVLEASTPDLDDVVRLKDKYGREGTSAP